MGRLRNPLNQCDERGNGLDGDLMAWRSDDEGRTWSAGTRINDVPGAAREGMHGFASGGRTWSANRLAYQSPTGSVCQCCHPTVAIDAAGEVVVMFRNEIKPADATTEAPPARDMYVVRARRDGSFGSAVKLGTGSWPLAACPMRHHDSRGCAFPGALDAGE